MHRVERARAARAGGHCDAYELACHSDGASAFTIAIGAGVGAWRVIAKLAVIPLAIGAVLLVITFIRRHTPRP